MEIDMKINCYFECMVNEWCAFYDDDEPDDDGFIDRSWGATREEAIENLKLDYPRTDGD
jgi:hypothetical protein